MHPQNCSTCSIVERLLRLPSNERAAALKDAPQALIDQIAYHWQAWGRSEQQPPPGDWTYWLIKAGRGFGKTRTGAETVRQWIADGRRYVNLIGATADDARDIMVQGESGILALCPQWERPEYKPSQRKLIWPNGAESLIFTADEPDRLRGKQHDGLWCDEVAAWRYAESWDQAKFGLRLGAKPQAVLTTTPRPTRLIREIMADRATVTTNGSTYDNRANLAPSFFSAVLQKYEGTRLGRQEIAGEVLDDNPGALFKRADIDKGRVLVAPAMNRIVVAIDPAATSTEGSDDTGIVAAGVAIIDGVAHGYILHDMTLHGSPETWAVAAVRAYRELKADRIVAEVNNGGEMIESVIRAVDRNVPVRMVHATRGKEIRAEPVAAMYEQGRIHHVGEFGKLEDQMAEWDPLDKSAKSPDRMDALVWAITDLMLSDQTTGILDYYRNLAQQKKA